MQSFQLSGIDDAQFADLFDLSDEELNHMGAVRTQATHTPGFPCRVSLEDATPGEELLLLPYVHQPESSPYHSSGPIFVRRNSKRQTLGVGVIPPYVSTRLMSVRAYDERHMMIDAGVCEGADVEAEIARQFSNDRVAYIHLHNAKRGCFSCRVDRVTVSA